MESIREGLVATLAEMPIVAPAGSCELWNYANKYRPRIENAILDLLPYTPPEITGSFNDAIRDAVFPGGKRLRPVMTLLGAELFGGDPDDVLPAAVAVEFVHTSSLVFDDLPSMDNADTRRGKESLHKKYGDGLATLVAIGYLNASYRLVSLCPAPNQGCIVRAIEEIVDCIGPAGMVGGQALDLSSCGLAPGQSAEFDVVRNLKTTGLMRLALNLGAIISGADETGLSRLTEFASLLGDAYQKSDDLLDMEEDDRHFLVTAELHDGFRFKALYRDLHETLHRAKELLLTEFEPSRARTCLLQLVGYIGNRRA